MVSLFYRYIEYICGMARDEPMMPHNRAVMLASISLSPVPVFNKMKQVYCTSCTLLSKLCITNGLPSNQANLLPTAQPVNKIISGKDCTHLFRSLN